MKNELNCVVESRIINALSSTTYRLLFVSLRHAQTLIDRQKPGILLLTSSQFLVGAYLELVKRIKVPSQPELRGA